MYDRPSGRSPVDTKVVKEIRTLPLNYLITYSTTGITFVLNPRLLIFYILGFISSNDKEQFIYDDRLHYQSNAPPPRPTNDKRQLNKESFCHLNFLKQHTSQPIFKFILKINLLKNKVIGILQ